MSAVELAPLRGLMCPVMHVVHAVPLPARAFVCKKPGPLPIRIRSVWAHNLEAEFSLIRACVGRYSIAAMDTEFPGVVSRSSKHPSVLSPAECYDILKSNVNGLKLIQVGLTLSNAQGNLPSFGTAYNYVWEFNFRDFDIYRDFGAPDSITLLMTSGIDFEKNRREGIASRRFAELMLSSGLIHNSSVTWATFHGASDFGYLIKALMQRPLPNSLPRFLALVRWFFGDQVYDIKEMMKSCDGLYGGLERVATLLKVDRAAGKSHQAGSDSLLTVRVFQKVRELYFKDDGGKKYAGILFGLEHQTVGFWESQGVLLLGWWGQEICRNSVRIGTSNNCLIV